MHPAPNFRMVVARSRNHSSEFALRSKPQHPIRVEFMKRIASEAPSPIADGKMRWIVQDGLIFVAPRGKFNFQLREKHEVRL